MRAARLLHLHRVLQDGRRHTARDLAATLQVAQRTVLRDLAVLSSSGVPVYGVRGPGGGFQLLDSAGPAPVARVGAATGRVGGVVAGRLQRVRVRLSPAALEAAVTRGCPDGWRARPHPDAPAPGRADWIEGSFRFDSAESALRELLTLAPEVEILLPLQLRTRMHEVATAMSAQHAPPSGRPAHVTAIQGQRDDRDAIGRR